MTTPSRTCHSAGCGIEVSAVFNDRGLCLDHYLQTVAYKLDASASRFRDGQGIDSDTLYWLLVQVDFVVEAIGDEASSLTPDQRTRLLELLLGIANLNEFIRLHSFTVEHTH